jgi:hypothetical protein
MIVLTANEQGTEYSSNDTDIPRKKRNMLLAETDWAAGSDVTMSDAMRTYRQALRDIPQQADFPNRFTIPVKPE